MKRNLGWRIELTTEMKRALKNYNKRKGIVKSKIILEIKKKRKWEEIMENK